MPTAKLEHGGHDETGSCRAGWVPDSDSTAVDVDPGSQLRGGALVTVSERESRDERNRSKRLIDLDEI